MRIDANTDAEFRAKATARQAARYAKLRGDILVEPCQKCGSPQAEMHHPDHKHPLKVVWLCRPCHAEHHRTERRDNARRLNQWLRGSVKRLKTARQSKRDPRRVDIFSGR